MTRIQSILLIVPVVAASVCHGPDLQAQTGPATADPAVSRRYAWRGIGPYGNPALRRAPAAGHMRWPAADRWRRPQPSRGTIYSAPYFAITTPWAIPDIRSDPYPAAVRPGNRKPFAGARPASTAVDRYWPLLMEAREDPKTGLIIWRLP